MAGGYLLTEERELSLWLNLNQTTYESGLLGKGKRESTAVKGKGVLQHNGKKKRKKESFVAQRNTKKLHTDNSLLDL